MCFVLGVATRRFAILAADTRFTYTPPGGAPQGFDWGGKMLRVTNGWASGTGIGPLLLVALDALRGVDAADARAVQQTLAASAQREGAGELAAFPDATEREAHVFMVRAVERGYSVDILQTDGEPVSGGSGFLMNWPPEVAAGAVAPRRLSAALQRSYSEPSASPIAVARRVGDIFAHCAEHAASVSSDLEMAFMGAESGYLRLSLAEFDSLTAPQLRDLLRSNEGAETAGRVVAARSAFNAWKQNERVVA